jgi:two-component system KDP operon response regulator KdpE
VIDDEPPIRKLLRITLEAAGYEVDEADTARRGLLAAAERPPDAILLDLGLPDGDGLEVLRRLREWSAAPVVILSARGQESDKVAALDGGADDYLTKPFGVPELLARVRVALRHAARRPDANPVYRCGGLEIDLAARRVARDGAPVKLTNLEYRLLACLARHSGKVLTHRQLLREVWGPGAASEVQYLRVFVANLRKKLEPDPARPRYLHTEQGVGYRLAEG